jgi:hypothetical protein
VDGVDQVGREMNNDQQMERKGIEVRKVDVSYLATIIIAAAQCSNTART